MIDAEDIASAFYDTLLLFRSRFNDAVNESIGPEGPDVKARRIVGNWPGTLPAGMTIEFDNGQRFKVEITDDSQRT